MIRVITSSFSFITTIAPPTITEITDDLSSAVGLAFTVRCVATGNPTPKVTLEQEGKNLSTAKSTLDGQTSSVELSIDSAVAENFKDVTCVATNKHGRVNKTVKVTEVGKSVVSLTTILFY